MFFFDNLRYPSKKHFWQKGNLPAGLELPTGVSRHDETGEWWGL